MKKPIWKDCWNVPSALTKYFPTLAYPVLKKALKQNVHIGDSICLKDTLTLQNLGPATFYAFKLAKSLLIRLSETDTVQSVGGQLCTDEKGTLLAAHCPKLLVALLKLTTNLTSYSYRKKSNLNYLEILGLSLGYEIEICIKNSSRLTFKQIHRVEVKIISRPIE